MCAGIEVIICPKILVLIFLVFIIVEKNRKLHELLVLILILLLFCSMTAKMVLESTRVLKMSTAEHCIFLSGTGLQCELPAPSEKKQSSKTWIV